MMNKILALPMLLAMIATGAHAADLRMTVEKPHFTCEGRTTLLSHVSYMAGEYKHDIDQDAPLPCCDGQIGCAQFLSTNTIIHPQRPLRG